MSQKYLSTLQDSFVSAQDTIADLRDFEGLNEIVGETDAKHALYLEALEHLEKDFDHFSVCQRDLFTGTVQFDGLGTERFRRSWNQRRKKSNSKLCFQQNHFQLRYINSDFFSGKSSKINKV